MSSLLVVDDDPHVRRLIELYLGEAGYDVDGAATGEEAIEAAASRQFDVAVIDLILPRYGGLRVCEKLKASPHPPRVVIITGDESDESRSLAAGAGADAFLMKPFTREELIGAVEAEDEPD